jgi:hypothetical protein
VKTLQAGKDLMCDLQSVKISDGAIIKCNYGLCVELVNKSNIQTKTPSRVTQNCDNIFIVRPVQINWSCALGNVSINIILSRTSKGFSVGPIFWGFIVCVDKRVSAS